MGRVVGGLLGGLMIELLPLHMAPNQLATLRDEPGTYLHPGELEAHLRLLHDSLMEIGAGRLAALDVRPVLDAVETFGFHLADLDIVEGRWHGAIPQWIRR